MEGKIYPKETQGLSGRKGGTVGLSASRASTRVRRNLVNGMGRDDWHVLINGHERKISRCICIAFEHSSWCLSICKVAHTKIELFESEPCFHWVTWRSVGCEEEQASASNQPSPILSFTTLANDFRSSRAYKGIVTWFFHELFRFPGHDSVTERWTKMALLVFSVFSKVRLFRIVPLFQYVLIAMHSVSTF